MQDKLRHPWAVAVALVFSLACLAAAPQGASAQDAGAFIQNLGTQGIQALGPSVPAAQRTARFRQLFDADFDGQGIARFVMGPHGRSMTPEQQQEFATLFRDYVAQTYSEKLATYGGSPFRVTGTRQNGDETIVTSEIIRSNGGRIAVDWYLIGRGPYKITDVYVGGVSMKVTQRDEFAAVIQRNGGRVEALIAQLRQKLAIAG